MLNKLEEVLEEVPEVRKDLGYPPLVTPTSQIVGVQAVMNVMFKERYKTITREVENYVKGLYGNPPGEINQKLKNRILTENKKQLSVRPADNLKPEVETAKKNLGLLNKNDEDLLIYLLFGEIGRKFLVKKYEDKLNIDFDLIHDDDVSSYPV
jgi:oxaloacetate decarboxylase alpha subunit